MKYMSVKGAKSITLIWSQENIFTKVTLLYISSSLLLFFILKYFVLHYFINLLGFTLINYIYIHYRFVVFH